MTTANTSTPTTSNNNDHRYAGPRRHTITLKPRLMPCAISGLTCKSLANPPRPTHTNSGPGNKERTQPVSATIRTSLEGWALYTLMPWITKHRHPPFTTVAAVAVADDNDDTPPTRRWARHVLICVARNVILVLVGVLRWRKVAINPYSYSTLGGRVEEKFGSGFLLHSFLYSFLSLYLPSSIYLFLSF